MSREIKLNSGVVALCIFVISCPYLLFMGETTLVESYALFFGMTFSAILGFFYVLKYRKNKNMLWFSVILTTIFSMLIIGFYLLELVTLVLVDY